MKKVFGVIALAAMVLAGCVSSTVWYRQNGLVPFEYFQSVQNEGERLVFISPVLATVFFVSCPFLTNIDIDRTEGKGTG